MSAIEWGLVTALILVVVITVLTTIGSRYNPKPVEPQTTQQR